MGARGPKPLPANVLAMRGSRQAPRQDGAVEPEIELPRCPKFLLPEARKFWKDVLGPELVRLGLVGLIDQAALELVCQERAWFVHHDLAYQADEARVAAERKAFDDNPDNAGRKWTGGDGLQLPTANGGWVYNPHWVARNKHALQLDKFLANFGMNPAARGRVTPSSRQMQLPGMEPEKGFGTL